MTPAPRVDPVREALASGGHICLVVDDDDSYGDLAADFLRQGRADGEKTVAFGPLGSPLQERLAPFAVVVADPYVDFLGLRGLEPATMFAMFREQAAIAAAEGYTRLRVAADMDWLLPAAPSREEALGFEVLLDRVISELDATVLCAYRRTSFDPDVLLGMGCIHPTASGGEQPPFKLVAAEGGRWELGGEIDFASSSVLAPALRATVTAPWVVDVSRLDFLDVASMRTIAGLARTAADGLELRHASPRLQRLWQLAGFDDVAPGVRFVA